MHDSDHAATSATLADTFAGFLERWLAAAERNDASPASRERVAAFRAAGLAIEALCASNCAGAVELICSQFRSEPLTIAVGFSDEVLRATVASIAASCIADNLSPSVVIRSHTGICAAGITVPFEETAPIPPDLPPAVARLTSAMNQINQQVLGVRRRLRDPLERPFEWLLAATTPDYRKRLPVGDSRPATLFQVMLLTVFEEARKRGYRTGIAHTNDLISRTLYDMGGASELTLPYSELTSSVRRDVPGSISFISGHLDRILAPFASGT